MTSALSDVPDLTSHGGGVRAAAEKLAAGERLDLEDAVALF